MRQINRTPLRDVLIASGVEEAKGKMFYQDYLNIVAGEGYHSIPPITEEQWEQMCDMLGSDTPIYASTLKHIIKRLQE